MNPDLINLISNNWETLVKIFQLLVGIVSSLIAIASVIVKFTPTLKDDAILLRVIKFLSKYIALNRTIDDDKIRKTL
jgi:hypothetical protein